MTRREFITLLAGATAWPLAAHAQQAGKLPTIGFIVPGTPSSHGQLAVAFAQRLRELGCRVAARPGKADSLCSL